MSQQNGSGFLSPEEAKAKGRREVALPSGGKVMVQRVGGIELAEILGHLPDVSSLATLKDSDRAEDLAKRPESRAVLKAMSGLLLAGVIIPKLYDDPDVGPTPRDFPLDEQLLLFQEILDVSGFTKEAGAKVLPLSRTAG
jgi:hypothetical protein